MAVQASLLPARNNRYTDPWKHCSPSLSWSCSRPHPAGSRSGVITGKTRRSHHHTFPVAPIRPPARSHPVGGLPNHGRPPAAGRRNYAASWRARVLQHRRLRRRHRPLSLPDPNRRRSLRFLQFPGHGSRSRLRPCYSRSNTWHLSRSILGKPRRPACRPKGFRGAPRRNSNGPRHWSPGNFPKVVFCTGVGRPRRLGRRADGLRALRRSGRRLSFR